MLDILLGFPTNLVWGALLARFYNPRWPVWLLPLAVVLILLASLALPDKVALGLWLPGGMASILLGSLIFLQYWRPAPEVQLVINVPLPGRNQIRESLAVTDDIEERQEQYLKIIKEYSQIWEKKDALIRNYNSRFLLLAFGLLFALNYAVLLWLFSVRIDYAQFGQQVLASLPLADLKSAEEAKKFLLETVLHFSPGIVFLQNAVVFLLLGAIFRLVYKSRGRSDLPLGVVSFFLLPEILVFLFIAAAAGSLALHYFALPVQVPGVVKMVFDNLLLVLVFLYLLQGWGTIWVYLQVRLLPVAWVFLFMLLLSLVLEEVLLGISLLAVFLGLADFWFYFRKKALQPRLLSDDQAS